MAKAILFRMMMAPHEYSHLGQSEMHLNVRTSSVTAGKQTFSERITSYEEELERVLISSKPGILIEGDGVLLLAYENGLRDEVMKLIQEERVDINQTGKGSKTLLHLAIEKEDLELIKLLASHEKMAINQIDEEGKAPIHRAIVKENLSLIRLLLKHPSIDPNLPDREGSTPLMVACDQFSRKNYDFRQEGEHSLLKKIKLLLRQDKFKLNAYSQVSAAISIAIRMQLYKVIKLLLSREDFETNRLEKHLFEPIFKALESLARPLFPLVSILLSNSKIQNLLREEELENIFQTALRIGVAPVTLLLEMTGHYPLLKKVIDRKLTDPESLVISNCAMVKETLSYYRNNLTWEDPHLYTVDEFYMRRLVLLNEPEVERRWKITLDELRAYETLLGVIPQASEVIDEEGEVEQILEEGLLKGVRSGQDTSLYLDLLNFLAGRGFEFDAPFSCSLDEVEALREKYGDIYLDLSRLTLLQLTVWYERVEIMEKLLQCDINPNKGYPISPLILAIDKGASIVSLLLSNPKIDPNIKNWVGEPLLMLAVKRQDRKIVQMLLRQERTDPNLHDRFHGTALYRASEAGYIEMVKDLISLGKANVNLCPLDKVSALYSSIANRHLEIAKELLKLPHLDPNMPPNLLFSSTCLTLAIEHNYEEIFHLLLAHPKIDPNQKALDETPLDRIRRYCVEGRSRLQDVALLRTLLAHTKLQISKKEKFLKKEETRSSIEALKLLMTDGRFNLSNRDGTGETPFECLLRDAWWGSERVELFLGASYINPGLRQELDEKRANNQLKHIIPDIQKLFIGYQKDPDRMSRELAIKHRLYLTSPAIPFAWMILLSDGYFRIREEKIDEKATRYLNIAERLPMELQMKIANVTLRSNALFIKQEEVETGLKMVLNLSDIQPSSTKN
jgi:ankyrin repeat protein